MSEDMSSFDGLACAQFPNAFLQKQIVSLHISLNKEN